MSSDPHLEIPKDMFVSVLNFSVTSRNLGAAGGPLWSLSRVSSRPYIELVVNIYICMWSFCVRYVVASSLASEEQGQGDESDNKMDCGDSVSLEEVLTV